MTENRKFVIDCNTGEKLSIESLHHKYHHLGSYCTYCIEYHDEKARDQMYVDLESGKIEQQSLF
ncbi:MAG: hypothetical protein ABGW66_05915 [Flavobacteriaceae bacterium]|jgi:hypothetical protein